MATVYDRPIYREGNLVKKMYRNGDLIYYRLNPHYDELYRTYLTFDILTPGSIGLTSLNSGNPKTIEYSINAGSWTSITSSSESDETVYISNLQAGDQVRVKGNNNNYKSFSFSNGSSTFNIYGNIMSLMYGDDFVGNNALQTQYTFYSLFRSCYGLISAEHLVLPATTLAGGCYDSMFRGCTYLTSAPSILPATTLAYGCYGSMFNGCTSLTSAPELPATTMASSCYYGMFNGCTSLTTAPELPATSLSSLCYTYMFSGCTNLTTAPELPATTLASMCYSNMFYGCTSLNYIKCLATDISALLCTNQWVVNVASEGTFVKDANTTWTTGYNGIPSGWTVEDYDPYKEIPLTFNVTSDGTIKWVKSGATMQEKTILYKLNDGEWTSITSTPSSSAPSISVVSGDTIQFKGDNATYSTGSNAYTYFLASGATFTVSGNIMSLIDSTNFATATVLTEDYALCSLFKSCTGLTDASNLVLPATTLTLGCYRSLFDSCSYLTSGAELPATTLAQDCYRAMFYNCSSLTTAPELPATTLANGCYYNMFYGCTSLTSAPVLSATTLINQCYYSMFQGCSGLTTAPALPATTLAAKCYYQMFRGCRSLTTAPELPATTLASMCYYNMFYGCSSLNYIKCLATDISAGSCTSSWVNGVASAGTFVKDANMEDWTTGSSGIPSGWTVTDAS